MAKLAGSRSEGNLRKACAEEYPVHTQLAREEGFDEIADWFDTVAGAERSHAGRLTAGLDSLS